MRYRHAGLALVAIPLAFTAACSSGGSDPQVASLKSQGVQSSGPADPALAYSQCVRAHGGTVPGTQSKAPSGLINISPADVKAAQACASLAPAAPIGGQSNQDAMKADMTMAACMRSKGITDWPDPLPSDTKVKPPAGGSVMANEGGTFILPADINMGSPKVQAAQAACTPGVGSGQSTQITGGAAQQ